MTLSFERIGSFTSEVGAEIAAYDAQRELLYVVSGDTVLEVLSLSDPTAPTQVATVDIAEFGAPVAGANSIAYSNGLVAVALEAENQTDNGVVALVDIELATASDNVLDAVQVFVVGSLPDMVTFTPDGSKILVANEGEPDTVENEDGTESVVDPNGSISVIDISGDFASLSQSNVATADFLEFDGREAELRADGVRIFPDATAAQDFEPEYIAVSPDGTKAFVTLQENNAIAIVDVETATVESIQPLGLKDFSLPGNGLDASDDDGAINIQEQPVFGLYMPDSIASFESNGETFYVIANEGDDRGDADEEGRGDAIRLKDLSDVVSLGRSGLSLDESFDAQVEAGLLEDEALGRLTISSVDGDTDGDGDLDQIVSYGGRSFSVLDSDGNIVFDSGDQIARITAEQTPELFNANDGDPEEFDTRSDNKGAEPEAVTTGVIDGKPYAFVGLERAGGGVLVYELSNPTQPEFVQYIRSDEDIAPEGLVFIPEEDSPNGQPLLTVANEESNTVAVYEIDVPDTTENFTLQLLHLADQEAGIPALEDAPQASAVINALRGDYENTLTLSSGDAIIPGLFFSSSAEAYGGAGRADILIQNELGIQAIAFGNHEFDLGTGLVRDLVAGEIIAEGLALEESQEVGDSVPDDTAATGSFTARLSANRLVVTGEFSDLTSSLFPVGGEDSAGNSESAIHIHVGAAGTNGPIFRNLEVNEEDGEFEGTFDLSDDEVEALLADGLYVNLHTENNPSGELRGQIDIDLTNPANFEGAQFPYLSSNLDFSTSADLADLVVEDDQTPLANSIAATTVIDVNGEQVGVVGATTPTLPIISNPGDVTVLPEDFDGDPTPAQLDALAAEIQTDVDEMLAANPGLNKVIVLSHMQQIAIEQELATRLTNVDVIVAGGSNTGLFDENDRPRAGDTVQGTYPIFSTDADGKPVAIVNTDGNYRYIGRLVVDFDAEGNIIPESYDAEVSGAYATDEQGVADLGAEGLVDPEIQAIVDTLEEVIVAKESNVFGVSDVYLDGRRGSVRTEETNLGNLTADANLAIAKESDASVVISLKNGGGIRDDIGQVVVPAGGTGEPEFLPTEEIPGVKPAGGISETDIGNTLRFNNGLTLLTITAEELLAVLEHSVAASSLDDENTQGRFPQVAGIEFSFDLTKAPGDRIQSVAILDEDGNDADVVVQNSEIVGDASRSFRMVTLGFLAGGGDGYPFPERDVVQLAQEEDAPRTGDATFAPDGSEQDALAEYLNDNFGAENPFNNLETARAEDTRIQNLAFREDTVIDGLTGGPAFQGDDKPNVFRGTDADEIIFGGGNRDRLIGNGGNDQIFGEGGRDFLRGGAGDDLLDGGASNNKIFGGSGDDTFVLNADGDSRIMDFRLGQDVIALAGGLTFGQLSLEKRGPNALILDGDNIIGRVMNTDVDDLTAASFIQQA
ncbi:MAG: choice-of-anchor I family protein [Cyanobacteria bacterium J06621_11]